MINSRFRNYLFFLGIVALAILAFSISSEDSEARLCVWDGEGAGALASTAANWDTDTAPIAGDNILFDGLNATGDDACTWDLATNSFGTFTIGAGYSGTITQSSDMHIQGYSQAGGTFTGVTTKWVYCSGSFIKTAGTLAGSTIKLNITDGNINIGPLQNIYKIDIHGSVSFLSSFYSHYLAPNFLTVWPDGTLNIITGITTNCYKKSYIYGTVNGLGTIGFEDLPVITGQINIKYVNFFADGSASWSYNHIQDYNFNSNLTISHTVAGKTYTTNLNGHSLTANTITVGTRGILTNSAATVSEVNCATFDSSNAASSFIGTSINLNMLGGGSLKLKSGETPKDLTFIGATTIYQNTKCAGALTIADGATVTDGAGTYRLNVTSAVENHTILGSWDMSIYFDGTPERLNLTVEETMGGVIYFQNETTLLWTGFSASFVPDGWCDVMLLAWDEATLNLYGAFYFNGNAEANMTVDAGRYSLWNGSASIAGIQGTNGSISAILNASSTLTFTLNPCPVFVTAPDTLDYYGGRYYYNADTNEELAGISQLYNLTCNFASQIVIESSGEVQGDVSDSLQHNYSLLVTDALGGWTYLNWTVEISLTQWNLRATIVSEENGWLKVKYDFDFQSNKSLLTNVQWNFGDGNGSKDISPVHAYDRAGVYLVTLIMFDEFGRSGTTTVEITVGDPEANQAEAYMDYWLNERMAGAIAIMVISVLLAALYVYVADKEWGGSYRIFPVAIILMGFIIALIVYGGY